MEGTIGKWSEPNAYFVHQPMFIAMLKLARLNSDKNSYFFIETKQQDYQKRRARTQTYQHFFKIRIVSKSYFVSS